MPKKGVRQPISDDRNLYRLNQRPPLPPSRREPTPSESTRSGPTPPSEDPRLWLLPVPPSTQEDPSRRNQPGTSTPSSSTLWALRVPSRPSKTTTHWSSSLTEELTNQWSRKLAKNSIMSRSPEWTPLLDLMVSRRPTLWSHPSKTPWTSPTRSVLCEFKRSSPVWLSKSSPYFD